MTPASPSSEILIPMESGSLGIFTPSVLKES
nr:MAG TPA: hypothetical protein [Bacteriophage sp.]